MKRKKKINKKVFPTAVLVIVKFTWDNKSSDLHKYDFNLAYALKLEKWALGKY